MAQVLVQVPDEMLRAIDRIAPSRQRSRFIQLALQKALMDLEDIDTKEAYRRMPDREADAWDPKVWDAWAPRRKRARRAKK